MGVASKTSRGRRWPLLALGVLTGVAPLPSASSAATPAAGDGPLDMYELVAPSAVVEGLVTSGYDVAHAHPGPAGAVAADLVLRPTEVADLRGRGLVVTPVLDPAGRSAAEAAAEEALDGFTVWRSFDEAGGLRDELDDLARAHPDLVERQVLGHSHEGREIIALRVTAGGAAVPDGTRPAVLHLSVQHAREWISAEVNRRLLRSYLDGYGTDPDITAILDTTELWFVVVANPDGYQRSFTTERLWRKNVADNDGDGAVTRTDGVDLNRNFPDHFGHDPEGSSARPPAGTYRGAGPASEPENQAVVGLFERVGFRFLVNYHSFGRLLLYPFGWQDQTPAADNPIYEALAGTPASPAIPGYRPQLSTELYVTNGETTSWAHAAHGTLSFTVELGEGLPGSGFVFPDSEVLVRQEYELNRPFALDLARSAADPTSPQSHLRNTAAEFVLDPFPVSYGDPQPVQATVARRLGEAGVRWRVNGGPVQGAATAEWAGGERYGAVGDVYYRVVRGEVSGTRPGDAVEVWFEGGGRQSEGFAYRVESTPSPGPGGALLVVVGGDHAREAVGLPDPPPAIPVARLPLATSPGTGAARETRRAAVIDALAGSGTAVSVYDVEAHGHVAPHPLGVLAHHRAVVWTTDDFVPGRLPATVSRVANDEAIALRDYLNEGGRVLYMGRSAGSPYSRGAEYNPSGDGSCNPEDGGEDGCVPLSDDVFQYWLGAYDVAEGGGSGTDAGIAPVDGTAPPFSGLGWIFRPPPDAPGGSAASFTAAAQALAEGYPHLRGTSAATYRRPRPTAEGPFPDAAAVVTGRSVLFGFGFEDVEGGAARADLMSRVLAYLLG